MSNLRANKLQHIAFCGGGSGGHLSPSIAVAQLLFESPDQSTVSFFISTRDTDNRVLSQANLPEDKTKVIRQPIASSKSKLKLIRAIGQSLLICRRQFKNCRPDIVVGTGGFASIAGVMAARWLKIPVVLLETNSVPGRANRFLNRFATVTCFGLAIPDHHLRRWRGSIRKVGVPIQKRFAASALPETLPHRILVLGGSLGAAAVNRLCVQAFAKLSDGNQMEILHQTGVAELDSVKRAYNENGVQATVVPFVADVATAITKATLVISRAGAVTLAEISAIGRPAILVPLSTAADDHQSANAATFVDVDAAACIDETAVNAADQLYEQVLQLLNSANARIEMQNAQQALANPEAAQTFLGALHEVISPNSG